MKMKLALFAVCGVLFAATAALSENTPPPGATFTAERTVALPQIHGAGVMLVDVSFRGDDVKAVHVFQFPPEMSSAERAAVEKAIAQWKFRVLTKTTEPYVLAFDLRPPSLRPECN